METIEHVADFEASYKVAGNNDPPTYALRRVHRVLFILSGQVNEKVLHLSHVEVLRQIPLQRRY